MTGVQTCALPISHGKLTQAADGVIARTVREREPRRYLARGSTGPPIATRVQTADLPFEFMMNALRLVAGFEQSLYAARTGLPWETVAAGIGRLAGRGLIASCDGEQKHWRPTELGQRFLNDLIGEFLPVRPVV